MLRSSIPESRWIPETTGDTADGSTSSSFRWSTSTSEMGHRCACGMPRCESYLIDAITAGAQTPDGTVIISVQNGTLLIGQASATTLLTAAIEALG